MTDGIIAKRYAKVLYQQALRDGSLDKLMDVVIVIKKLLKESVLFREFLQHPLIKPEQQQKIIDHLLSQYLTPVLAKFLDFLIIRRRLSLLSLILNAVTDMYADDQHIITATIISAYELEEPLRLSIEERLQNITTKKIIAVYQVDASMIGGIRIFAAGRMYEYALNNELQDYKRRVLATL